MALPSELYLKVLSNLSSSDLAALARCSRTQCQIVTPILYRKLSLHLYSGDPDASSTLLLRTLSANPRLRYFIRQLEVVNASSTYWTSGHSKLLGILLSSILTHPDRITSFTWKAGLLPTHIFFPEMSILECTRILNMSDLLWVRWHLLYCRSLKSIRLHVSKRMDQRSLQWFLSNLSLQRVRHLHLQGADLTTMNIDVVDSLQTLDLKLCRGLDGFLARLVSYGVPQSLKVLRLAGDIALTSLECFLSAVASKTRLEELSLRIGGATRFPSTKAIQALAPGLSTLVLDFRQNLSDPRSSLKYTIKDFQDFIKEFPLLRSVGFALDLRNPKCQRYQRTKFVKDITLENSSLEYLHLRGHCVPLKRSILDAKHLAAPFVKNGRLRVLLDHGSRLRKLSFSQKSYEFSTVSDEEQLQLSTDLYGVYG
ncbi:hypothetical protein E5D57_013298 [Metarhizium anisopliae]|nr:hypothetical protein E5D57_013298 [Metarhizium anisopliae]